MAYGAALDPHAEHPTADAHAAHPTGLRRWLFSTNHKDIGTLYLTLAIVGMFVGGTFSILMRINLQSPGHHLFANGQEYNVIVTGHGLIMVFFVIMPALIGGLGNWFVPLMIGAPDMAFPRMNNLSFWMTACGMCLLLVSRALGRLHHF